MCSLHVLFAPLVMYNIDYIKGGKKNSSNNSNRWDRSWQTRQWYIQNERYSPPLEWGVLREWCFPWGFQTILLHDAQSCSHQMGKTCLSYTNPICFYVYCGVQCNVVFRNGLRCWLVRNIATLLTFLITYFIENYVGIHAVFSMSNYHSPRLDYNYVATSLWNICCFDHPVLNFRG